jgi:hypothetical protein
MRRCLTLLSLCLLLPVVAAAQGVGGGPGVSQSGPNLRGTGGNSFSVDAQRGAELAPAIVAANWTCGAGWDCSVAGTLNKNADGVGTVVPNPALTAVAGTTYEITITVGALTVASGATYTFGSTVGTRLNAAGTYTDRITAITTTNLTITPAATATRFTIAAISVKALTDATGDLTVQGNLRAYSPIVTGWGPALTSPDGLMTGFGITGLGYPSVYYQSSAVHQFTSAAWINNATTACALLLDSYVCRDGAAGRISIKATSTSGDACVVLYGTNNGYLEKCYASELVTIAAAASTDTSANLLPANAVIDAVTVRVVTLIPTAATFNVGDATVADRFATGVAVAANTTAVGVNHHNPTKADNAGPVQAAAAKVRITPNASPAAATGQVRVQVQYSRWVAPTT